MAFLGPLSLAPVIERLKGHLGRDWREVGGAADLNSAEKAKFQAVPAAYAVLASDQPRTPTSAARRFIQPVTGRFGVLIALRDYQPGQRGAADADELLQRVRQVRSAIIGWVHPESTGTACRMGGRSGLLKRDQQVLIWQEVYSVEYHIRTGA